MITFKIYSNKSGTLFVLEIYAGFDSLKHCQVAFTRLFNKLTNYTGKNRKKKKRKSPKRIFTPIFNDI